MMNEQMVDNATDESDAQDNFAALNQVMVDEERRKRREKKQKKKRKKKHRGHSPSSCSNRIREDVNSKDKITDVEAVAGVELQENRVKFDEAATRMHISSQDYDDEKDAFLSKHDEVAATDLTAWSFDRNQRMQKKQENLSSQESDVENTIAAISSDDQDAFLRSSSSSERVTDADNDSNVGMLEIPHDSFSMFYAASGCFDHILPTCVFFLQVMILVIIAINLLQDNNKPLSNRMNVPVGAPVTVTMSQYIACFVSVLTADDFITGILYAGKRIMKDEESLPSSHFKWELSNLMRTAEGAILIFVSFIFIVQSDTAIDLFLNFAGVTFVGTLDDVSFFLATNGFLGKRSHILARRVSKMRVHHDESRSHTHRIGKMEFGRYVLFAVLTIAMWSGLSFFVARQDKLVYACKSVVIEVGDTRYAWARHYSGSYSIIPERNHRRAVYTKDQGYGVQIYIAYCSNRWVVSDNDNHDTNYEVCGGTFGLMSERTRTFDLSEVGQFRFWTGEMSGVDVKCADCDPRHSSASCGWQGDCNATTRKCDCYDNFFGPHCEHVGPCTEVVMDEPFTVSKNATSNSFPKSFQLMYHGSDPLMWMGFPVYDQQGTSRFMFFDGLNWNVIEEEFDNKYDLVSYLTENVTAYDVIYISEPSNSGSPADIAFRAMLANVESYWEDDEYLGNKEVGRLGEKEFYFSCADCTSEDNTTIEISFCTDIYGEINREICEVENNTLHGEVSRCNCNAGFMGPLCHIRPAEGQISIYLDQSGEGFCHMCGGETNPWSLWELDGITTTCLPFPKKPLTFKESNGTFTRQVGLNLNETHFSIFVSDKNAASGDELCRPGAGNVEIYSLLRSSSSEQIHHDYAIQLNGNSSSFGEIVDPEGIECKTTTTIDQSKCGAVGNVKSAWIQLDMKTTPVKGDEDANFIV